MEDKPCGRFVFYGPFIFAIPYPAGTKWHIVYNRCPPARIVYEYFQFIIAQLINEIPVDRPCATKQYVGGLHK